MFGNCCCDEWELMNPKQFFQTPTDIKYLVCIGDGSNQILN